MYTALELAQKLAEPAHILVVDDDVALAEVVADYAARFGCLCDLAHTGAQALGLIWAKRYDLILLDVRMPGISGIDVLNRLRDKNNVTPVVIMSGYPDDVPTSVKDFGVVCVMLKPFTSAEFVRHLVKILDMHKLKYDTGKAHELIKAIATNQSG